MLYILYSKQQESQGKKLIAGRFKDAFGIDAIKKFTNKSKVDEKKIDENLDYLGTNEEEQSVENRKYWTQEDFVDAINKRTHSEYTVDDIYTYSRPVKDGEGFWWYGILKDEVMRYATTSNESRLLVCTDIEIIQKIASVDGDVDTYIKNHRSERPDLARCIRVYCLIRKKMIESRDIGTFNEVLIKILQDESIESEERNKIFQGLSDGTLKLLDRNGIIDNAFFNNIVLFNNLLIIKDVGDMKNPENVADYNKTADQVIEKYVGIFPIYKKIFVVHPMGNSNGVIPDDEQRIFRKFVQCIFYDEIKNGRKILFAEDVQNQNGDTSFTNGNHSDFELTSKILESINNSSRVVCDLRYVRTNCLYEYGYAKGLCEKEHIKDVCLLYQEGDEEALSSVFDVRNANAFYYPNIMQLKNLTYEDFYRKVELAQRKFHLAYIPYDNRRHEIWGQFQDSGVKNISI